MIPHGPSKQSGVHIEHFIKGLVTNRAAISVPFRFTAMGQVISYQDALIDGLNVEISPKNTLVRRPGFPNYCSAQLAVSESVNGFYGATLPNASQVAIAHALASTTQNVYDVGTSTLTSIYTKTTTAQSFFQQAGNWLYFSDGASNLKWDGINTPVNAGLATPVNAPTIPNLNLYDTVGATQTTHAWVPGAVYANTTASPQNYFLLAPTGEIFWAVVPAGTTLQSQTAIPNWSSVYGTFGATVTDGTMQWTDCGVVGSWKANTAYANNTFVANNQFNAKNTQNTQTITGSSNYTWTTTATSIGFAHGSAGFIGSTNTLNLTGLGFAIPSGATIKGITVRLYRGANRANACKDVTVQLLKAGVGAGSNKAITTGFWPQILWNAYNIPTGFGLPQDYGSNNDLWGTTWTPSDINNANFGVTIVASNTSLLNTSAAITYNTQNNNVTALFTITYTVSTGDISGTVFAQIIQDQNGNLQGVKVGGTSGAGPSPPSFSSTVGATTADNTITWQCLGTAAQVPCLFNRTYAYGFHTSGPTNHLSTMSPLLVVQAPIVGNNVAVTGFGSNDTQVDSNNLYRTTDGGSLLLYDNQAINVNASTSWTIFDTAADTDLNIGLIGPVAHANDPPPAGGTIIKSFMGRMWMAVGQYLYFSAGPDCINGDGNQAWPPANVFTFSSNITGLAPTSQGLIVFTANDMSIILGGPQALTFWPQTLQTNFGILNPNCLVQDGDTLYLYTTQQQLFSLSASAGKNEIGLPVANLLAATFPAATSSLALHRAGQDQGLFISDGSANIQRYNLNSGTWDPIAQPVNGAGVVGSIQTAIGTQSLLSATAAHGFIIARSLSTFSDNGTGYSCFATIGSIPMSQAGTEPTRVTSFVIHNAAVGSTLGLLVLPNEISGSFTNVPKQASDPPQLTASTTIIMNRYDWLGIQTQLPNWLRHLQVKITMPNTDTVQNEVYGVHLVA